MSLTQVINSFFFLLPPPPRPLSSLFHHPLVTFCAGNHTLVVLQIKCLPPYRRLRRLVACPLPAAALPSEAALLPAHLAHCRRTRQGAGAFHVYPALAGR